jgi:hypothetical protein
MLMDALPAPARDLPRVRLARNFKGEPQIHVDEESTAIADPDDFRRRSEYIAIYGELIGKTTGAPVRLIVLEIA